MGAAASLPDPESRDIDGAHHRPGVDTERAAAQLVRPRAGLLRRAALDAIAAAEPDGLTDQELADATGEYLYTIAPRRVELVRDGWVIDSGIRRMTQRGRKAVVWTLSADGRRELALP